MIIQFSNTFFCVVWSLKLLSLDLRELDSFAFLTSCRTLLAHLVSYVQSVLWVEPKVKEIGLNWLKNQNVAYEMWLLSILPCQLFAHTYNYICISLFLSVFISDSVQCENGANTGEVRIEDKTLRAGSSHHRQYLLWAID